MNKRSAMVVAAGVVAAMAAGAISLSATGGSDLAQAETRARAPHVRTVHRTITVHRTAAPAPSVVRTIAAPGSSMTTAGGDDAFEQENEQESESEDGHQGSSDDAQATFSSSGHGESGDD
jgi:hypothetical protein